MSTAKSFSCPNCGSPLTASGTEKEVKCLYCDTSVIVPVELRDQDQAKPHTREQFASNLDKLGSLDKQDADDFDDLDDFDVVKNGADGIAKVWDVDDLGAAENMKRSVSITLEVTPAAGEPFDILAMPDIPRTDFPKRGTKIKVKYNPADKSDIAVLLNGNWYVDS